MDAGTGLTILGSAIGSAKLVEKLLGPTADYIGEGVKHWTEKRVNNVSRIFSIAAKKLGDKINEEGSVPPKVLKGILDEASFCDDELAAEYFGGVLASSRSGIARDDRGAYFIALLSRLSTYQIRSHYCFYHIFKRIFNNRRVNISTGNRRANAMANIPVEVFNKAMDFSDDENSMIILHHAIAGLTRELLIDELWGHSAGIYYSTQIAINDKNYSNEEIKELSKPSLILQPTIPGVELFLWAYGKPELAWMQFFDGRVQFDLDSNVEIVKGSRME